MYACMHVYFLCVWDEVEKQLAAVLDTNRVRACVRACVNVCVLISRVVVYFDVMFLNV